MVFARGIKPRSVSDVEACVRSHSAKSCCRGLPWLALSSHAFRFHCQCLYFRYWSYDEIVIPVNVCKPIDTSSNISIRGSDSARCSGRICPQSSVLSGDGKGFDSVIFISESPAAFYGSISKTEKDSPQIRL